MCKGNTSTHSIVTWGYIISAHFYKYLNKVFKLHQGKNMRCTDHCFVFVVQKIQPYAPKHISLRWPNYLVFVAFGCIYKTEKIKIFIFNNCIFLKNSIYPKINDFLNSKHTIFYETLWSFHFAKIKAILISKSCHNLLKSKSLYQHSYRQEVHRFENRCKARK